MTDAPPTIRRVRPAAVAVLLAALLGALALPALAQDAVLDVAVRGSTFEEDGTTTVQVNVSGSAKPDVLEDAAFTLTENGEPVTDLSVEALSDADLVEVTAILALDASSSMEGELLEGIKAASSDLVATLTDQGIAVGVMEFGTLATLLAQPTLDAATAQDAIDGIEASGSTALYDAVLLAVEELRETDGVRELIVLADGEDNISTSTFQEALDAAVDAEIPITVIGYETELFEPDVMLPFAEETAGRFVTAQEVDDFAGIFAAVAEDVASQYTLTYSSTAFQPDELDIGIQVEAGDATAEAAFVVANPRSAAAIPGAGPQPAQVADSGIFGDTWVLYAAVAIVFVVLIAFLMLLIVPRGDRAASKTLRRGLTLAERPGAGGTARSENALSASMLGQRVVDMVAMVPRSAGYDDRLQTDIDRAGWQMRASEFSALRLVTTLGALALLWAITGNALVGLLAAVIGAFAPPVVLATAKRRRQAKFMEQLPDTLQLLAGTLKAGYGILQAIDTVVKEMDDPIASEFQRALTESRLGLPLEDSLHAMAERVESPDFGWVVVAINIQRQIGGNLAELLETVAETLRSREQVRRQIQVLSAEGKLSAYVLIALPFVILGYLTLVNPGYLSPLLTEPMGWVMAGGALFLMGVGVVWMRRLIKIDV